MRPPAPPPDAFADMAFPTSGVDLSMGYAGQRPGSTRVGVNVRACEPATQRLRGGARPGLSEYAGQIPGGAKVQHLNTVVMASDTALPWNFSYPFLDLYDPSSPGQAGLWGPGQFSRIPELNGNPSAIPTGGWMFQPNKNTPAAKSGGAAPKTIQFVQTTGQTDAGHPGDASFTYAQPVTKGDLLLLCILQDWFLADPPDPSFSDNLGTLYQTLAGPLTLVTTGIHVWYRTYYGVAGGTGTCTVTVTSSHGSGYLSLTGGGAEYSGTDPLAPLDSVVSGSQGPGVLAWSVGPVPVSQNGSLVVGLCQQGVTSADSGESLRSTGTPSLADVIGAGAATTIAGTSSSSVIALLSVGASFKPALG